MLTVKKLKRKPEQFHAFTGLTPQEFDKLLAGVEPVYQGREQARHEKDDRRRQVGGGHPFTLPLAERLLMTLMYFRVYLTQGLLGFLFDLDDSNVGREINQRMRPVLLQVLPIPMRDSHLLGSSPPSGQRLGTLSALLAAHPELRDLLLDATEQEIYRPQAKLPRRQCYSGKQKQHTLKTQMVATPHLILHILGQIPGSVHDYVLLQGSGVLHRLPPDCSLRLDRGYEGVEQAYPEVTIEKPIRRQRGTQLTVLGKLYNQMVSRLRIPVEHMIGRTKQFNILAQRYRGRRNDHEDIFAIVAGLVNFSALGTLSWT